MPFSVSFLTANNERKSNRNGIIQITELQKQIQEVDFAVLVLGADDIVESRNEKSDAPRDNVIFELGLFRNLRKNLFSDLLGIFSRLAKTSHLKKLNTKQKKYKIFTKLT